MVAVAAEVIVAEILAQLNILVVAVDGTANKTKIA